MLKLKIERRKRRFKPIREVKKLRILVVEDDEHLNGVIARGLKEEGHAVDVAFNGPDAQYMAEVNPYDLIVLDWMLPGRSGIDVCERLRQKGFSMPVLMLTAKGAVADRVQGLDSGADDYLTKPFAFAELLVRIKALLRRGVTKRSNVVRIGDLEIDRITRQVRRSEKPIKLTSKEYGLLEYLAINVGRVLSRTMIVEHVWDQSFEGLTNIVDVYVRQLRAKIDEPFEKKLIHTVRSVGYAMRDPAEA